MSSSVIGIALGPNRFVAYIARGRSGSVERWERVLESAESRASRDELAATFAELRASAHTDALRASVALLPGLMQVKRIEMPKLRDHELRAVLTRDAARYFFAAREPQVVAAQPLSAGRGLVPVLAACASAALIEDLISAAASAGWEIDQIVPAYSAWAREAARQSPQLRKTRGTVGVVGDGVADMLTLERGQLSLVRRSTREVNETAADLTITDPLQSAAAGAAAAALPLLPSRIHESRARRTRVVRRLLLASTAACFLAGALLELWGTRRELARVEAERAAIRVRVDRVMRLRDAVGTVQQRMATLSTLDRTAPQWSSAMATVASHLPMDAHLVAFRGRADSLVLEGTAERATGVFEGIQRAPGVSGVRANAPIRQELDSEQQPVEHFAVALRLAQGTSSREEKR